MIFAGKINKKGNTNQAFSRVGKRAATHLKIAGENVFYKITNDLVIREIDEDNTAGEQVSFKDMTEGKRYLCEIDGEEYALEDGFYAQMVFMSKDENGEGDFYRTDGGKYIRKADIQVPAYKGLNNPVGHLLTDTKRGKHYTNIEYLTLPDGREIYLPNEHAMREGDKWYYILNGHKIEATFATKEVNYTHMRIGDQVISTDKFVLRNNEYYAVGLGENGSDLKVGEVDVAFQGAVVEDNAIAIDRSIQLNPSNTAGQRSGLVGSEIEGYTGPARDVSVKKQAKLDTAQAVVYKFDEEHPGPRGLKSVHISADRKVAKLVYNDHTLIYRAPGGSIRGKLDSTTEVIQVEKIELMFSEATDSIEVKTYKMKDLIATDVKVDGERIVSYNLGANTITDIQWNDSERYEPDQIVSYVINGTKISNIVWQNGEILHFTATETDENGKEVSVDVKDVKNNPAYKHLAIKLNYINKIDDIEWGETGITSFKLGKYKFNDVEWNPDRTIGECTLVVNGVEEHIDFANDARFKHLSVLVTNSINEQEIQPLMVSKLVEKKGEAYQLKADFVQTEQATPDPNNSAKDGYAPIAKVETVAAAMQHQKRFENNKYKTFVIDENGTVDTLSDLTTTYKGVAEFDFDNDVTDKVLGDNKVEYKKGKVTVQPSDKEKWMKTGNVDIGFGLCAFLPPLGMLIGIPMLLATATTYITAPITRSIKAERIAHQDLNNVTKDMQIDVQTKCKQKLNQLSAEYARKVKIAKKEFSTAEARVELARLEKEFRIAYCQEVTRLQMLGEGSLECSFDLSKKSKVSPENYLAYLACIRRRAELIEGKFDHVDIEKILNKIDKNTAFTDEQKVFERVGVLQELGGRKGQIEAYKIQKANAEKFMQAYNLQHPDNPKTLEEFNKMLDANHKAGKSIWGSLEDKLEIFKESKEYIYASPKERKEMLREKRASLEKEANSVQVGRVEFNKRYNADGNPLADECILDAMENLENVIISVANGDKLPKLEFGVNERALTASTEEELNNHVSKITDGDMIDVNDDLDKTTKYIEDINEKLAETKKTLDNRERLVSRINDFESAYRADIVLRAGKEEFKAEIDEFRNSVTEIPNRELSNGVDAIQLKITEAQLDAERHQIEVDEKLDEMRKEYQYSVVDKVKLEYIANHSDEFATFAVQHQKKRVKAGKSKLSVEGLQNYFINYKAETRAAMGYSYEHLAEYDEFKRAKNIEREREGKEKLNATEIMREFYAARPDADKSSPIPVLSNVPEIAMLLVKNNIEERVSAEAYCKEHPTEYAQYVANMQERNGKGSFADESEYSICGFYAKMKAQHPNDIAQFKQESSTKQSFIDTAQQLIEDKFGRGLDGQAKKRAEREQAELEKKNKIRKSIDKAKLADKASEKVTTTETTETAEAGRTA